MPFWLGEPGRGWGPDDLLCSRNAPRTPLTRANGTSRRASGWVRKSRAVEDQSAPIPEEKTSELEREHLYRAMSSLEDFLIACLNGK